MMKKNNGAIKQANVYVKPCPKMAACQKVRQLVKLVCTVNISFCFSHFSHLTKAFKIRYHKSKGPHLKCWVTYPPPPHFHARRLNVVNFPFIDVARCTREDCSKGKSNISNGIKVEVGGKSLFRHPVDRFLRT